MSTPLVARLHVDLCRCMSAACCRRWPLPPAAGDPSPHPSGRERPATLLLRSRSSSWRFFSPSLTP